MLRFVNLWGWCAHGSGLGHGWAGGRGGMGLAATYCLPCTCIWSLLQRVAIATCCSSEAHHQGVLVPVPVGAWPHTHIGVLGLT